MRVLIIGLGSMGKRRLRLLQSLGKNLEIAGTDSSVARRDEVKDLFSVNTYDSVDDAIGIFKPDTGFICTSPLSHADITGKLLNAGIHVFSEINLVLEQYDENIELAKKNALILFLSSTPMYRKEIEYITGEVKGKEKLRYRYHVGQYLPDWHPWESYTDFFVGNKLTNGCRELFAIELPWLTDAFGEVCSVTSTGDKLTDLNIDFPDCYTATIFHEKGTIGQLCIDVVCPKAIRDMEIFGDSFYMKWGGTPDTLTHFCNSSKQDVKIDCYDEIIRDGRYADNIIENAYVAEIENFFEIIKEPLLKPKHSFEKDRNTLSLIDRIEEGSLI